VTRIGILTWDWREQPSLNALRRILDDLAEARPHIAEVDTGSDQYAWAFSTRPLSTYGLDLAWQQYEEARHDVFDLREEA
jgi:hypothetical protein